MQSHKSLLMLAFSISLALYLGAFGATSASSSTQDAASTKTTSADLSALAWIAGHWSGVQGGLEMEELWLEPKGNTMLGLHRDVGGGRTRSFEYLRIVAAPDGITYWASPGGRPATPFRLKELRDKHVVFENPDHDFPQRISYWLTPEGMLHARIEGTMNGKAASEEWAWRKTN